jgi:formamidopyrimidine-DNA glycosylase
MPELPEVEVTARRIASALSGMSLLAFAASGKTLRYPIPLDAIQGLTGLALRAVTRRAKYLLLEFDSGWLAVHLGMSGSLQVHQGLPVMQSHDHLQLIFCPSGSFRPGSLALDSLNSDSLSSNKATAGLTLVLNDPRRFGSVQWIARAEGLDLKLLGGLLSPGASGMEPFDQRFCGDFLHDQAASKQTAVKPWLMQGHVVVGVGNIYASEALFAAGIHPARAAGRISLARYRILAKEIQRILQSAIAAGGSTIRDFLDADGQEGRYGQSHQVYGKAGMPCPACQQPIRKIIQAQRSTFYCHGCQR